MRLGGQTVYGWYENVESVIRLSIEAEIGIFTLGTYTSSLPKSIIFQGRNFRWVSH